MTWVDIACTIIVLLIVAFGALLFRTWREIERPDRDRGQPIWHTPPTTQRYNRRFCAERSRALNRKV